MRSRKEEVLEILTKNHNKFTAKELADELQIDRTNVSRYLNELTKEGVVQKIDGRPVRFQSTTVMVKKHIDFDNLIGRKDSLKSQIQKAKAAILYPPRGLHTLIFGETGTGKTMFAECMYRFAITAQVLTKDAPFITFNCADYAQNPQLLYGHIFGVKRGAFTGAEETRKGLLEQADGGILFLDEIHRLPPEGQEMLFTFIDKGTFRSLGDEKEKQASVQIIGATTETSSMFLKTFNRRIPMQIELPALAERSLDERLAIIKEFLQQEANRLKQEITIDRRSLLAFLLYRAEGNIGQLKRDLKLVCAKAFLHHQTSDTSEKLAITEDDLPLIVQKGLLRLDEVRDKVLPLLDNKQLALTLRPGKQEVVWEQDPNQNMEVYDSITYKLEKLSRENLSEIDLGELIAKDVERYFETYIEELSHTNVYREIISDDLWRLVNELYDLAAEKLQRNYDEKERFTFALHLNSTIERILNGRFISHPNLNDVRRNYPKEFQLAIEFSARIEEAYDIMMPLDEIGFITMFLTSDSTTNATPTTDQVEVFVVMHGRSTASSMLETVQELLGTTKGKAFNMPLTLKSEAMYRQIKQYIQADQARFSAGIILLTDMGSPNDFGKLIEHELGVRTKVISMTSTMIVLESLRLAILGRSLAEIYSSVTAMLKNVEQLEVPQPKVNKKKAIIVACFTGEGVSKRLNEIVSQVVDRDEFDVIQLQSLEREGFKQRIDQIMLQQDIVAIVGTLKLDYQNIPFIPAADLFEQDKILEFQKLLGTKISLQEMATSLTQEFSKEIDPELLLELSSKALQALCRAEGIVIENNALQALSLHIAFLVDKLKKNEPRAVFKDVTLYRQKQRRLFEQVASHLKVLEDTFAVRFDENDIAYIVKTIADDRIDLKLHSV
ncbi:MAG: sigma 54-interacting transcriptional regulator [Ligilactobacillus animalis]|uniref:sigma 54-interacting transcriptional regulator n=1 Tax=Ligilactobacillus animalis TaxID=1605 RepID=UPI00242AF1F9|nr:sigma-54-dependent transcriptional regulator [Ligilactobacillus animalis]MCI5942809.1 sigma 54-interacting transcriptional regulator [Ligilactobacillus animalis]MDY2993177.1 sigma 54-interacting transcriptional regulator [Ligilactobacillus animalis]